MTRGTEVATASRPQAARPLMAAPAGGVSQATSIEQARAVAEVMAMVQAARAFPRDETTAIKAMQDACGRPELAERAFWRYDRGGKTLTGETVVLMRTLAQIWGNVDYGLLELRRDEDGSELMAFAWDLETNTRSRSTFIVPARLYIGGKDLTDDLRALQENNASVGGRRTREAINAVLPPWFVEEAKALCRKTLSGESSGKPLPQRRAAAIESFAQFGVTVPQLEAKIGKKHGEWEGLDLALLRIIHQGLVNGERTKEDEFPDRAITPDDVRAGMPPAAGDSLANAGPYMRDGQPRGDLVDSPGRAAQPQEPAQPPKTSRPARSGTPIAPGQLAALEQERARLEFDDPAEWVATVARIALVPDLAEIGKLTAEQAQLALKAIRGKTRPEVTALATGDGQGTLDGDR